MTAKEKLLNDTYTKFVEISLSGIDVTGILDTIVDKDIIGFGTTVDEKIFSFSEFQTMLKTQKEQSQGLNISFKSNPNKHFITDTGNTAVFSDDIFATIVLENETLQIYLRFSAVLEYRNNKWVVINFHGSKPEYVDNETDTFGIDIWKQKNAELEKLVEERTSELSEKNRELEIETALEKVRSVAMGMTKPADMLEVCKTISHQLQNLGVKDIRNVQTAIFYENKGTYMNYEYYARHNKTIITETDYTNHTIQNGFAKKMLKGKGELSFTLLKNKEVKEWLEYQKNTNQFIDTFLEQATSLNYYWYSLGPVALGISTYVSLHQEDIILFERFRNVFELAYTRYLDIEQAIAQAREAKIETSLERVRAIALSLKKPEELTNVSEVLYTELLSLGFDEMRNAMINIHNDEEETFIDYDYSNALGKSINHLRYNTHPLIESQIKIIRSADDAFSETIFAGKDLIEMKKFRKSIGEKDDPRIDNANALHYYFYSIGVGSIGISTFSKLSEEKLLELKRFRNVFEFAYRRYMDLALAEAQTREAQIENALEKVRSRTLAMQKSDELAESASELFRQMIGLGIEPNRLYITIIHETTDEADFWITDEDGSKLTEAYTTKLNDNDTFIKMYDGWKQQLKHLVIDMHGEELQNYFQYLQDKNVPFKGGLEQKRRVQHLAYFSKGFIGLASPDEQPAETMEILDRFASVFNLTYTRFNDLKIAEAHAIQAEEDLILLQTEKKKAENALTELKSTQTQLIQSEKMASLGELTAGIAHEIQNPLNFVNNFSEVSAELLAEMQEEINSGNLEDAKEILNDVLQNLEKINHHGKRADAIVKGMLQHSRSSSGKKELTDLNALCDEYLRLSYHGLRAKDKSFNALMKTDFEKSIGKVNIIPQDFGRVVLNLLNNAFYAVNEKNKSGVVGYEPTVSIATKKENDKIIISVSDNGNGMPAEIIDKIFQPFFTTKPTGHGTGLGLSLSYDIITKGHNGELKVTSEVNQGTSFSVIITT